MSIPINYGQTDLTPIKSSDRVSLYSSADYKNMFDAYYSSACEMFLFYDNNDMIISFNEENDVFKKLLEVENEFLKPLYFLVTNLDTEDYFESDNNFLLKYEECLNNVTDMTNEYYSYLKQLYKDGTIQ